MVIFLPLLLVLEKIFLEAKKLRNLKKNFLEENLLEWKDISYKYESLLSQTVDVLKFISGSCEDKKFIFDANVYTFNKQELNDLIY